MAIVYVVKTPQTSGPFFLEWIFTPACGWAALRGFSLFLRSNVKRLIFTLRLMMPVFANSSNILLVVARSRERHLGSASAVFSGAFDLGSLIGSPILGVLIETQGYSAMFLAAAVWIGIGVVVFAWWDHHPVPDMAPERV